MTEEVYKKLAKHLSSLGMGYPQKEELLEILCENFTPLEAEVALALPTKVIPFETCPAEAILSRINLSREELEQILSNLSHRGLLFFQKDEGWKDGVWPSTIWLRFSTDLFLGRGKYSKCTKDGSTGRQIFEPRATLRNLRKDRDEGLSLCSRFSINRSRRTRRFSF